MNTKLLAKNLFAIAKFDESIAINLLETIQKKLLSTGKKSIVKKLLKELRNEFHGSSQTLTVQSKTKLSDNELNMIKNTHDKTATKIKNIINESLIDGYIVDTKENRIDYTAKAKLIDLYQKLLIEI